jgi:hypothetical protein
MYDVVGGNDESGVLKDMLGRGSGVVGGGGRSGGAGASC